MRFPAAPASEGETMYRESARTLKQLSWVAALVWFIAPQEAMGSSLLPSIVHFSRGSLNQATASASNELVEFTCCGQNPPPLSIDVTDEAIRIDARSDISFIGGAVPFQHVLTFQFEFPDAETQIVGALLTFAGIEGVFPLGDPVGPFSQSNVRFTGDSVELDVGGYKFATNSFVEIALNTVPEPSAAILLGSGLIVLAMRRSTRS